MSIHRLNMNNPFAESPKTVDGRTVDCEAQYRGGSKYGKRTAKTMAMRTAALAVATLMGVSDVSDGSAKNMQDIEQHPGGAATEIVPQEKKAEVAPMPQNTETFGTSRSEISLTDCLKNTRLSMDQCLNWVMAGN